jgi:pimeloyl-ACP methyl ester carboxylesterase
MTPETPEVLTFECAGHTLTYEVHGRGDRVVVLLHAILLDANINRALATTVADHGYRVVLLDLLGHGRSDRPRHASSHRMDLYARHVVALLDELDVDRAVVGGVSLGADVALQVAVAAPERVQGLIAEMPVLEAAAPVAAMVFVPWLLGVHYLQSVLRPLASLLRALPAPRDEVKASLLSVLSSDPDETAAVLHGVLLGPIAPTIDEREAITAPTLVIGHPVDRLHPFSDAQRLSRQIPNAELLAARSIAELRRTPARLTREVISFLDRLWLDAESAAAPA